MSLLSGYLPVEQGVACLAALRRLTEGVVVGGDDRTRDQIMADTLVERLTGQARAADVAVEIQLVVPAELATDPDSRRTATVTGGGPLPGALARDLTDESRGAKHVRRLRTTLDERLSGIDRGAARLERSRRPRRARPPAVHRADHHPDRTRLHRPGTRPAVSSAPPRGGRVRSPE